MAGKKRNSRRRKSDTTIVALPILTRHLRAIVEQLEVVISAAEKAAQAGGGVAMIPRVPNILLGRGCQGMLRISGGDPDR